MKETQQQFAAEEVLDFRVTDIKSRLMVTWGWGAQLATIGTLHGHDDVDFSRIVSMTPCHMKS